MTFGRMFEIICGEGGIPVDEFWKIRSIRVAELLMEGVQRRGRTVWEVGRMLMAIQINQYSKRPVEPEDIVTLPWVDQPEDDRSDEERQAAVERAAPLLEAMINKLK